MEETPAETRLKSIFDGFVSLQGETYEFISRSVAVDGWLKEAHRLLQENPGLKADELYQAWQPALNQVYHHLFAAFLRPSRMMMFPFGGPAMPTPKECPEPSQSSSAGNSEAGNSEYRLWAEAGSRFLKGYAEATGEHFDATGNSKTKKSENDIDGVNEMAPLNLASQMAQGQVKLYFETAKQFFGALGDNQFLFSKNMVVHLQKLFDSYPRVHSLSQQYESMLWSSCEKAQKKLAAEMTKEQKPVEFKAFLDTYTAFMAREYDDLLKSTEFIETQNSFFETTSDVIVSLRKTIEARLESFPFLPFVTSSEMVALEKNVHSYKRRVDALERRIAELEDKLGTAKSQNQKN